MTLPRHLSRSSVDGLYVLPPGESDIDVATDGLAPMLHALDAANIDVTVIAAPAMLLDPNTTIYAWTTRSVLWVMETGEISVEDCSGRRQPAHARGRDPVRRRDGRPGVVSERDPVPPDLLGIGRVDPTVPGQPWWRYRRAELPDVPARLELQGHDDLARADPSIPRASRPRRARPDATCKEPTTSLSRATPIEVMLAEKRSPLPFVLLGFLLLICLYFASRGGNMTSAGSLVVPIVGLLFASAAAIWQTRRHPDEPFLLRWLVLAVVAKLVASYLRYITLVVGYEGKNRAGDATRYHETGHELALWWLNKGPDPNLPNYRRTNFVYWFDGVVQTIVGNDFLAGFFVFGLLAVVGSYLWYRAAADVVPILDKRLYFLFVMFAPSIVFWPSSIGKEALMQLGIGALSLGLARLVQRRLFAGLLICAPRAVGWCGSCARTCSRSLPWPEDSRTSSGG